MPNIVDRDIKTPQWMIILVISKHFLRKGQVACPRSHSQLATELGLGHNLDSHLLSSLWYLSLPPGVPSLSTTLCPFLVSNSSLTLVFLFHQRQPFFLVVPVTSETRLESGMHSDHLVFLLSCSLSAMYELTHGSWRLKNFEGLFLALQPWLLQASCN